MHFQQFFFSDVLGGIERDQWHKMDQWVDWIRGQIEQLNPECLSAMFLQDAL